jgi:hypothetical protein
VANGSVMLLRRGFHVLFLRWCIFKRIREALTRSKNKTKRFLLLFCSRAGRSRPWLLSHLGLYKSEFEFECRALELLKAVVTKRGWGTSRTAQVHRPRSSWRSCRCGRSFSLSAFESNRIYEL